MKLQDFAAAETSAVIERLLARRAGALRDQLRAVSDALSEAERAAEAPLAFDGELEELTGRLDAAFAEEIERIRNESRSTLDSLRKEHEAELQRLHAELEEAFADVTRLGTQLETIAAEKGQLTIELGTARGELQMALSQRDAVAAQLKASLGRAQVLGRSQADTGEPAGRSEIAAAAPEHAARADGGDAGKLTTTIDAAVRSVEDLTDASSTADLLNRLAQQLSKEFCRVALFRVQGNRLQGEHQVGFDYTTEVRKIAMPLSVDSLLTRVVSTGQVERLTRGELADETRGAPFRGSPTLALALPVLLRGEAIAVAYVDNWDHQASAPGRGSDDASVLFARLVIRQTGVLFIGLAHEMRVLTELRDYASMLLEGAEQMYAADVDARMSQEALSSRLEDNLACARQLFSQRAALEGPAAAGLLDEQIAATIEADPSSAFVRELVAIAVRAREAEARRSEAS